MATIYDDADEVVVVERLPYLDAKERGTAEYLLELEDAFTKAPGKGSTGFFKATFKVIEASGDNPHPVGARVVNFIKPDEYGYHVKDIKSLVAASTNTPVGSVSKANIDEFVEKDDEGKVPAAGVRLKARIAPKKEGSNFLKIFYAPVQQ